MKVLVTGGSGYLGIHVRRFFSADDMSRRSNLNILSEYDAEQVKDYDVVIHLAAHLDKDPDAAALSFRTNVDGTTNLLRHMRKDSIFIYASTKDVYGAHAEKYEEVPEECATSYCGQTALEWSKLIGERYVEYYAAQRGFRACIFRLSIGGKREWICDPLRRVGKARLADNASSRWHARARHSACGRFLASLQFLYRIFPRLRNL
jgi:nucleoside-diphosphate-sugar epimerase